MFGYLNHSPGGVFMKVFNSIRFSQVFLVLLILMFFSVPRTVQSQQSWHATVGGQSDDMAKQAGKRKNGAKADATVGLPPLNLHAAGIDVGSAEHYVAGTAGPRCRTGAKIHGEIAYADSALGHFIDFHIYTTIL